MTLGSRLTMVSVPTRSTASRSGSGVSKRWVRARETYGIEIAPDEDDALILAATVCIDGMADR
jgi:uncharacterized protein YxjI